MRRSFWLGCAVVAALGLACGSDNGGGGGGNPPDSGTENNPTITISGMAFSPLTITVNAGDTLHIVNNDSEAHTVTTEANENDFTPGGVNGVSFDTGAINAGSSVDIPIPADAASGTDVPYYCSIHTNTMATPNGHLVIQ